MKIVEAFVAPSRLERVRVLLNGVDMHSMTVSAVRSFARDSGENQIYLGTEYRARARTQIRIEIVLEDARVPMLIERLVRAARRGRSDDGTISVLPVSDSVRIQRP